MMIKIIGLIMIPFLLAFAGDELKAGDAAPDFELKDSSGKVHKLSDYNGQIVALYFYPKNNTAGCTAQACNIRDNYSSLKENDVVILGVSYDDSSSHKEFAEKYDLPFTLLSDTKKKVAELYNAKPTLIGSFFAKRITYVIGKDGKIIDIIDEVDTSNHSAQILASISNEKN